MKVFRVDVRDNASREHEGWACCYLLLFMLPFARNAQRANANLQAVASV